MKEILHFSLNQGPWQMILIERPLRGGQEMWNSLCMPLLSNNNPSVVDMKGLLCPCALLVIFCSNSLITQQILSTASSDEEGSGSLHSHMRCSSSISRPRSNPSQEACSWPWGYRPCCPMDSASRLHVAKMPLESANLQVWLTCLSGLWSLGWFFVNAFQQLQKYSQRWEPWLLISLF